MPPPLRSNRVQTHVRYMPVDQQLDRAPKRRGGRPDSTPEIAAQHGSPQRLEPLTRGLKDGCWPRLGWRKPMISPKLWLLCPVATEIQLTDPLTAGPQRIASRAVRLAATLLWW